MIDVLVNQFRFTESNCFSFRSSLIINGRCNWIVMHLGIYFDVATEFRIFHKSLVSRELQEPFRVTFQKLTASGVTLINNPNKIKQSCSWLVVELNKSALGLHEIRIVKLQWILSQGRSYIGAWVCTGIPNNFSKTMKYIYDIYMCIVCVRQIHLLLSLYLSPKW